MSKVLSKWSIGIVVLCLAFLGSARFLVAADETKMSEEEIKNFLKNAKVVNSKHTSVGVTAPWKLTLSDGKITHDGFFQSIDEHKTNMQFASGRTEMLFVDSWKYNLAAYELARMLGLGDMMPVYVERKWEGKSGSLSWGLPIKMDERERLKQGVQPPDPDAWNKQMRKKRVFAELAYDTDPNLTNLLIGEDWKVYMIDFTRAFRMDSDLANPKNLTNCDRQLFEKLKQLDEPQLEQATKGYLTKSEVKAVMKRRDKIVALFQKLIAEKGENEVLY